jgi:hypothetical protein
MSADSNFAFGSSEQVLQAWGGIVTGTIESWAEALGVDPADVEAALETANVDPLFDTAVKKGRAGTERPTSPDLRSVALDVDGARKLRANLENDPHAKDAE